MCVFYLICQMVCAWLRGFMCRVGNCSSKYVGFYGLGGVLWICVEKVEVEKHRLWRGALG
jgi:hypothetical protein